MQTNMITVTYCDRVGFLTSVATLPANDRESALCLTLILVQPTFSIL